MVILILTKLTISSYRDVLSGALLEEALDAAVDADAQLTAEDLTNEIAKLEAELGMPCSVLNGFLYCAFQASFLGM